MLVAKLTYQQTGDNYDTKDPIKIMAQKAAKSTAINLTQANFQEIAETRGESAYVWDQGDCLMAAVIEGLGTKNLVADAMRKTTGKTYYGAIGHDTVATIINDLISVGAKPLVMHAYWAVESNDWLSDTERMQDLITGWKDACDIAGCSWGGGETPTLKQILVPGVAEFGGSAVGIIKQKGHLVTDKKLQEGDRILFLKSTGINANGLSLARAIGDKLPEGYATKMANGQFYGEGLLEKSNIYAKLLQDLLKAGVHIHYVSNITGHGMRKVMRADRDFSYIIEKIFEPQEVFKFIQQQAELTDSEMYETYNMGMDYAIFLPKEHVARAKEIVTANHFESVDGGYITAGERKVVIEPKKIIFTAETLQMR